MKVAYCIDRESVGGGCEYIRRSGDARRRRGDACRTFYSDRGECRARVLDAWGAEEVVVNHLKALLQLLGRPWERPKARLRFVVHGIHLRGVRGVKYVARRVLESRLYHRCDEIVALTESDRVEILRLYGRDLNVVVEPNTLAGWTPHLAKGLPPGITGTFRYICIGRFCRQKGQDRWIRRMRRETSEGSGCGDRTLFIGDGETLDECRKLADALGVTSLFSFAGAIPDAERYLKCGNVVVSPSRWEGMPYLLMKARALGCDILATDCPGNKEVLAGYDRWTLLDLGR